LVKQPNADKGQRLLGHIMRQQPNGLSGGLSKVPTVSEEIVQADLQSFRAGSHSERTSKLLLKDPQPAKRCQQAGCRTIKRVNEIDFSVVKGRPVRGNAR
jgi:hypothetical protein